MSEMYDTDEIVDLHDGTTCEGDGIAGFNTEAVCYRIEGCSGCDKCWLKCEPKCSNCPSWEGTKSRAPEPGDWVVVQSPVLDLSYKGKWVDAMNMGVGRVAWVKNGNPVDGFQLKFSTTKKEILDQFLYPLSSLRLAMKNDMMIDKMIKTTKEGTPNEDM
jgi:hypothetical protein